MVWFTDKEVLAKMNGVIEAMRCVVEEREKSIPFIPVSGRQNKNPL